MGIEFALIPATMVIAGVRNLLKPVRIEGSGSERRPEQRSTTDSDDDDDDALFAPRSDRVSAASTDPESEREDEDDDHDIDGDSVESEYEDPDTTLGDGPSADESEEPQFINIEDVAAEQPVEMIRQLRQVFNGDARNFFEDPASQFDPSVKARLVKCLQSDQGGILAEQLYRTQQSDEFYSIAIEVLNQCQHEHDFTAFDVLYGYLIDNMPDYDYDNVDKAYARGLLENLFMNLSVAHESEVDFDNHPHKESLLHIMELHLDFFDKRSQEESTTSSTHIIEKLFHSQEGCALRNEDNTPGFDRMYDVAKQALRGLGRGPGMVKAAR